MAAAVASSPKPPAAERPGGREPAGVGAEEAVHRHPRIRAEVTEAWADLARSMWLLCGCAPLRSNDVRSLPPSRDAKSTPADGMRNSRALGVADEEPDPGHQRAAERHLQERGAPRDR